MKILKPILYILLAIIVLVLIVSAFVDGKNHFEKSVSINATPDKVWSHTNSLKLMDTWSPWNKLDPNMKKEWTGATGQTGEKNCWEGNEQAGKGCQEVLKVDAANGKSIGEERATLLTISKETEPEQNFFPLTKLRKIS